MISYAKIIGWGVLRYRSIRYHSNMIKYLSYLGESQWWSIDKLEKYQEERLKQLVKHVGEHVPFYKRLFKELKIDTDTFSLDQLNKIPPVTKDFIRSKREDFIAVNYRNYPHTKTNTSGSTGSPFNYLLDLSANEMQEACAYRGMGFAGCHYGDKIVRIGGSAIIPGEYITRRQKFSNYVQRIKPLAAIKLDMDKLNSFVYEINKYKPSFIIGYPSSIYILAKHIEISGKNLRHYPKAIITTAEMLLPKFKEKIENIFCCNVFNEYGCNDGGLISYECREHHGFHYAAERTIMEIDANGGSLYPSGYGEVVLTDLYNYSMPFIRYKNGDVAKMSKNNCSCGRGLPLIESIYGRSGDILKFNDRYISMPALTLIFKDFNFDFYQLIKKTDDLVEINVIKSNSFKPFEEKRLLDILTYHLGERVTIRLNYVNNIEVTSAGKWKFFIDASKTG